MVCLLDCFGLYRRITPIHRQAMKEAMKVEFDPCSKPELDPHPKLEGNVLFITQ